MDIIFYSTKIKEDYLAAYHDCNIKPCVGDGIEIKGEWYKVVRVAVSYDKNTIHVFVK